MTCVCASQGGLGEVHPDADRRLERREQRAIAAPKIQDRGPRRHLASDEAVQIVVVVAVSDPRAGSLCPGSIDVGPDDAPGSFVEAASPWGGQDRFSRTLVAHKPGIIELSSGR